MLKEKIIEKNTWNHRCCPNCGMMYQMENRDGAIEIKPTCGRCGCPFDLKKATVFMDQRAIAEHDPAIAEAGRKLRGDALPGKMLTASGELDVAALKVQLTEEIRDELRGELARGELK